MKRYSATRCSEEPMHSYCNLLRDAKPVSHGIVEGILFPLEHMLKGGLPPQPNALVGVLLHASCC
jgi:hypothetical protein